MTRFPHVNKHMNEPLRETPESPIPHRAEFRLSRLRNRPVVAFGVALTIVAVGAWWILRPGGAAPTLPTAVAAPDSLEALARVAAENVVRLDTSAERLAGIELMTLEPTGTGTLVVNGAITYDANLVSVISSRAEGRILSVSADLGEQVSPGTVLATILSSDVGQARGDLERTQVTRDLAKRNYDREKRLFEEQISPEKELLDAEVAYRSAEADFNGIASKLRALGAAGGSGATFGLRTPVSGTIVERNASPGQIVGPSASVFTVANLGHLWVTADVYERDLALIRTGAVANVTVNALPGEVFPGRVTYAGGVVDTATHTFKVRVEIDNKARRLRPGMFAQVRVQTLAQSIRLQDGLARGDSGAGVGSRALLTVPEIAVQELNGKQVVFVAGSTRGEYFVRAVTIGTRVGGGFVTITDGLRRGERIAVKGAFQLKAQLTKASFGEGD